MIKLNPPLAFPVNAEELTLPEKLTTQLVTEERAIRGKVVDDRGAAVMGATVVIKGTHIETASNIAGLFNITPEKGWKNVVLVIFCVGFETIEIKVETSNTDVNVTLPVRLQAADMVEIIAGLIVRKKPEKNKASKTIQLLTQKFMDTAFKFFKVFPNPASSGTGLHIEWKQTEEGYFTFELIDVSGKKVYSKEIWIDEEARLLNLEVPSVRPGNYFLRAANKRSGKTFTERITIQ